MKGRLKITWITGIMLQTLMLFFVLLRTAITNQLFKIVTLTDSFLKDLSAKKLVKKAKRIPHVIMPLILAENFAGKKTTKF